MMGEGVRLSAAKAGLGEPIGGRIMKAGGNSSSSLILAVDYGTWSPSLGRVGGARVSLLGMEETNGGVTGKDPCLPRENLPATRSLFWLGWGIIRAMATQRGGATRRKGRDFRRGASCNCPVSLATRPSAASESKRPRQAS